MKYNIYQYNVNFDVACRTSTVFPKNQPTPFAPSLQMSLLIYKTNGLICMIMNIDMIFPPQMHFLESIFLNYNSNFFQKLLNQN